MELSQALSHYISSTTYDDLPAEVVEFTNLCILDYFGSAFAGSNKPPVQKIDEMIKDLGGNEQATMVTGGQTSVMNAALVNGAASHVVELDDIHKSSIIHAATVVIPAALAIAEWKKVTGKELITAVVIGYEVCFRIGEAVSPSHYYFWHNTSTCGTFGATVASAKLLGLTEEQIIHALGNAGTQAAGLWEFIENGAMTKQLHTGKAAMNGVISALLSEKNFTGARKILEGDRGFFEAMSEDYKVEKVTDNLGSVFKIMENSFKVHASCRHTHHAMDLMIDLFCENPLNLDDIKKIIVKTYQVAIHITDNDDPETEYASKFSLQYCTALALLKGNGNLDSFNPETLWDERIRTLMERVEVVVDPAINAKYPEKWGAKVEVYLTSGETVVKETDYPKGDPENSVTKEDLLNKFMNLATVLPEDQRRSFAQSILGLHRMESIQELMSSVMKSDVG